MPPQITKLRAKDLDKFTDLIKLFETVFEMERFELPSAEHLQKLLARQDFDVFVALHNGAVVGGLTVYVLEQYYSEKPLAYIYDVAVDDRYQRQGIGGRLIAEVKEFYKDRGVDEMFVQADKVDDRALAFYRKTDPTTAEEGVNFSYLLNG